MFGCRCFYWSRPSDTLYLLPDYFSLPAPIPDWPPGSGFGDGTINLGEIEVCQITTFDFVWRCKLSRDKKQGVNFYKPVGVPDGFSILGFYCQSSEKPLRGFVLAVRESFKCEPMDPSQFLPALLNPLDYMLVWNSDDFDEPFDEGGYFWLPEPPKGYRALGFVVTNSTEKPILEAVKCVRADLTDDCKLYQRVAKTAARGSEIKFKVWCTRPSDRGMHGKGVSVGTFFCSTTSSREQETNIACLKNTDCSLHAMPNLNQIHALIRNYGPTMFFHPEEIYFPSSVQWFFMNGALLYRRGETTGQAIDDEGSNLPVHGANDREYWIDLPNDHLRESLIHGNLESAKLYVHVKPALGGTFTDIVMWVFCPFNGPATLKLGIVSVPLGKVGQHVGDWEHFTLRISNFTGELWSIYFSQHSGGKWIDPFDLEFIQRNKAIVYSSKSGHASYPHPGVYIQGSSRLGIGIRNDAARSDHFVDSSSQYEIIAAEYLGDGVVAEPCWLQYMREWGPKTVYDSRNKLERLTNRLPSKLQLSLQNIFNKLPVELYGEEGPTGPKEKNNWLGDERW